MKQFSVREKVEQLLKNAPECLSPRKVSQLTPIAKNKVNDDNGHKSPKIDKRQKREIEDKKNAEISYV